MIPFLEKNAKAKSLGQNIRLTYQDIPKINQNQPDGK
jgi:hypothetical protein